MGTTAQKLQAILDFKTALKTAIAKYDSTVGDTLSNYAPIVSDMADDVTELSTFKQNFGNFVTGYRMSELVIPFSQGLTLRPYLFYGVKADHIYLSSGFKELAQNQFRALNYGASSSQKCYLHLPNTIETVSLTNLWVTSAYVVPVLQQGWQATFELPNSDAITTADLYNIVVALKDLTGLIGQALYVTSAQYDLLCQNTHIDEITGDEVSYRDIATGKGWTVAAV